MGFYLGKLAFLVLRPSNLLLLLALAGLLGSLGRRRAWAGTALALGIGGMAAATLLPLGNWAIAPLEDRFPAPPGWPERVDGVVVLGGGVFAQVAVPRGRVAIGDQGERYLALLAFAGRYPQAKVVFTGGIGSAQGNLAPESRVIAMLLDDAGVPPGRVLLEGDSRTTAENARNVAALVRPRADERWYLVTSAAHMPRAMGAFRQVGWEPIPWPVDYRSPGPWDARPELLVATRLQELDDAFYEIGGLAYYRLLGWTNALFPGPRPG